MSLRRRNSRAAPAPHPADAARERAPDARRRVGLVAGASATQP